MFGIDHFDISYWEGVLALTWIIGACGTGILKLSKPHVYKLSFATWRDIILWPVSWMFPKSK